MLKSSYNTWYSPPITKNFLLKMFTVLRVRSPGVT